MRTVPTEFTKQKVAPVYLLDLDTLRWVDGGPATVSSVAYVHAPFIVGNISLATLDQQPVINVDCSNETYRQLMLGGSLQDKACTLRIGPKGATTDASFRELYSGTIDETELAIDKRGRLTGVIRTLSPVGLDFTVENRVHPDNGWNHILEAGVHEVSGVRITVNDR